VVVRALKVLSDESSILLLNDGIAFLHVLDVGNHQTSLSFDYEDLQVAYGLCDVRSEVRLQLVVLIDLLNYLIEASHLCRESGILAV
jgi:hypothetical protein